MLPLIGTLQETGLTEDQLRESLRRRPGRYMHTPQLALYVRDYSSRQVAVIGAVSRPGLSSPASEPDPVLEMIALAGGIASEAIAGGPSASSR
jgi:polysaccharide export outer membrane protein